MKAKMLVFAGMGFELVGLIMAGLFIGQAIDTHFGLKGLGVALFMVICLAGWFIHLIYLLKRLIKDGPNAPD